MAWTDILSTITTALTGYTRLPNGKDADLESTSSVHAHKGYSLKCIGIDGEDLTSNAEIGSYMIELKISYRNKDNDTYDENIELIESVKASLVNLAQFAGFNENVKIENLSDTQILATFMFNFGVLSIN